MFSKLRQFKDLRSQSKKLQGLLEGVSTTENSAGGKVVLTMDGSLQITGLAIDNEMLAADKKTKLEDAIKEAHNSALKKMQKTIATKMQQSGDFNLPGLS